VVRGKQGNQAFPSAMTVKSLRYKVMIGAIMLKIFGYKLIRWGVIQIFLAGLPGRLCGTISISSFVRQWSIH
jgi:hypothetical protein